MNYTFNKKLIEQVKAGTHCIEFNREKDSLEMLQALCKEVWPDYTALQGTYPYYYMGTLGAYRPSKQPDNRIPISLSNFVQPEQLERDVMAELDERLKRLEDILLRDNDPCKAEPTNAEIVNPVRWRAEVGGLFYFVTSMLDITTLSECFDTVSTVMYNRGNYFQTTQQAEEMAVLMQFTLNNPELVKQLMDKKE